MCFSHMYGRSEAFSDVSWDEMNPSPQAEEDVVKLSHQVASFQLLPSDVKLKAHWACVFAARVPGLSGTNILGKSAARSITLFRRKKSIDPENFIFHSEGKVMLHVYVGLERFKTAQYKQNPIHSIILFYFSIL